MRNAVVILFIAPKESVMNDFKTARYWLTNADAIIISASNGLSVAEGYNIFAHDEAFMTRFGGFL